MKQVILNEFNNLQTIDNIIKFFSKPEKVAEAFKGLKKIQEDAVQALIELGLGESAVHAFAAATKKEQDAEKLYSDMETKTKEMLKETEAVHDNVYAAMDEDIKTFEESKSSFEKEKTEHETSMSARDEFNSVREKKLGEDTKRQEELTVDAKSTKEKYQSLIDQIEALKV